MSHLAVGKLGAAAIAIGFFTAAPAAAVHALPNSRAAWPIFTVVVEKATAPPGWAEFCAHYSAECHVASKSPDKIAVTSETWEKIAEVNNWVNTHIRSETDKRHWGRVNKWTFAEDGRGDCKDYVLVKRRKLLEAGFPREALLIAIVWTRQNQGHAVLIVRTDKGDYVLDSLSHKIVLWAQTSYDFVMRQTQSNPNDWVFIDGNPLKAPGKAAEAIEENPVAEPVVVVASTQHAQPSQPATSAEENAPAISPDINITSAETDSSNATILASSRAN